MKDDTKKMLFAIGLAALMAAALTALIAFFVWSVMTLLGPELSWLEQNGLRGLWCGTGGCE